MVRTLSYICTPQCFGIFLFKSVTRKLRKERRKAMREAYYARERKEAAYQASSSCNCISHCIFLYFHLTGLPGGDQGDH